MHEEGEKIESSAGNDINMHSFVADFINKSNWKPILRMGIPLIIHFEHFLYVFSVNIKTSGEQIAHTYSAAYFGLNGWEWWTTKGISSLPSWKSVLPHPRMSRASPVKAKRFPWSTYVTQPFVCPNCGRKTQNFSDQREINQKRQED